MNEMTIEELLRRCSAGERDFTKIEIAHTHREDFMGINLSGADFRFSDLRSIILHCHQVNFSHAILSGLDLCYAHFEEADLNGADLSDSNLEKATCHRTN